jgi:site-specific recombinase XerD
MLHILNWHHENQLVVYNRKAPLAKKSVDNINLELSGILNKVQHIFFEHRVNQKALDATTFKMLFASGSNSQSFHEYYQQHMELHAPILAPGTVKAYNTNKRMLAEFMPQMQLHHLTPETIKRFDAFLRHRYNNNTRMKHHRMAKHVMLLACKKHHLPNPYDGFKIKHINGKREYLNKYEVAALIQLVDAQRLESGTLSAAKKYLFSCHCGGLRISDIHQIGIDDVYDGVLVFVPQKTSGSSKRVQIPLPDDWQKWVQHTDGALFFDVQADAYINRCLKVVAKMAGIKKRLTFHTARHTFATGYLNAGGKVEVLQRILGHSDIKTTMVYVHISRERLKDESANVHLYK